MSTAEPSLPVVVFIGAPGAGKSRIGKRVALLLDVPFVDTDKRVVAAHGPIAEIFATHGEPHFRVLERQAVEQALAERAVVSLGGGAVLDSQTQAQLDGLYVIELQVEPRAVKKRIKGPKRPLLAGGIASWKALVEERQPLYTQLASRSINTTDRSADQLAAEIAEWIKAESQRSSTGE